MTDRFKIKLGELEFILAPASYFVKKEISEATRISGGKTVFDLGKAQYLYIKHCLKDISGIQDMDGEPYKLQFEGDTLTDECVSEIFNIPVKEQMMVICWQFLNEVPDKIIDPITKEELQGVQLDIITSRKPPS